MESREWKIGELSKHSGLSVRTLHHYDHIGLFSPSRLTEAGHRLYTDADVSRLHQIISLKQLGFTLDEIKGLLLSHSYHPEEMLSMQLSRLNEQIEAMEKLRDQVRDILEILDSGQTVSGERFMMIMQMMRMLQSPHFMPDQVEEMRDQFKLRSTDEWGNSYSEGMQLIEEFRKLMKLNRKPNDPEVAELAVRWKREIDSLAPVDDRLIQSAEKYYGENPHEAKQYGMDKELYDFIKQAVSYLRIL